MTQISSLADELFEPSTHNEIWTGHPRRYCQGTQAGHDRSHVPKASVIYAWLHAVQHSLSRRHPLSLSTRVRQGGEDGFICETSGPDASVGTLTPVTTKSVISE
jgi:hypothetical protein